MLLRNNCLRGCILSKTSSFVSKIEEYCWQLFSCYFCSILRRLQFFFYPLHGNSKLFYIEKLECLSYLSVVCFRWLLFSLYYGLANFQRIKLQKIAYLRIVELSYIISEHIWKELIRRHSRQYRWYNHNEMHKSHL